jgi:hypothetical protein
VTNLRHSSHSPAQGSKPGTTAPGAQPLPQPRVRFGADRAALDATDDANTPGTYHCPELPKHPDASKKLDTPSSGGGTK